MKQLKILILPLLLAGIFSLSYSKEKKDVQKAFSLHIFSSTNLTGNLDPCG